MTFIRRFDHVGITVADLDAATAFFVGLGLAADHEMAVEGEFLDTVIGMTDARTEIVMGPSEGKSGKVPAARQFVVVTG
jgi:catechol 2,3-dioxygenase-like lactoylglutathione lyase family enzyme